jgi:hypothetical protein
MMLIRLLVIGKILAMGQINTRRLNAARALVERPLAVGKVLAMGQTLGSFLETRQLNYTAPYHVRQDSQACLHALSQRQKNNL